MEKIEKIREQLLTVFSQIEQEQQYLPEPDSKMLVAKELLQKNQYDVVVCGEIKKGKSSLINAIIGADVLPTNTEVATSQVFRIINDSNIAFYLVFTDGSKKAISQEDLSKYGSQVDADRYGDPVLKDHYLDYIEVHYPISFLPPSIVLVDTPGIGALYAAHERITQKWVKNAAAVVFVTDPQNPLSDPERIFVDQIRSITHNILFVLSKVDNYSEDYITNILRRNEEILSTEESPAVVLPMSSKTLRDTSNEDNEVLRDNLLEESKYSNVKSALLNMVSKDILFASVVESFNAIGSYNTEVVNYINDIQQTAGGTTEADGIIQQKSEALQLYSQNWGANGGEKGKFQTELRNIITLFCNNAKALFSPNSETFQRLSKEIDNLESVADAQKYAIIINRRFEEEFGSAWKDLIDEHINRIAHLFSEYETKLNITPQEMQYSDQQYQFRDRSFSQLFFQARNHIMGVSMIGAVTCVAGAAIGTLVGWFVVIPIGILTVCGLVRSSKLDRLKTELKQHAMQLLGDLNVCYTTQAISDADNVSRLQKVANEMSAMANKQLETIIAGQTEKARQISAEVVQLKAANQQDKTKRLQEIESLQQRWTSIQQQLNEIRNSLVNVNQTIGQ